MRKFFIAKTISFLFPAFFSLTHLYAQSIDSTINKYATKYEQERIYIQYDKSTYAPGETIWFKAYLMKGFYPAEESKNFYADWTDESGNLIFRTISPIVDGTTNGQFDIPKDFSGKLIHVRAYTKWMLNFDQDFLYDKDLLILYKNNGQTVSKNVITPSLQFFPEGGDAVAGLTSKIAFKANDQWGKPIKIKGVIKNNQGKIIDSLRVIHDGMGYFFITPQAAESFSATWSVKDPSTKNEKEVEYTTALPAILPNGVSLQITLSGNKRVFNISASLNEATRLGKVNLIGTMYQHEIFKITKDISTGITNGVIPTQDLPSGILTITVFDDQWKPLAERITYVNNEEYLFHSEMTVEHWGLNKRARNEISISVPDSLQAANLAISVTDASIDADSSDNIISRLLLTGELRGQVYNPYYYFSNTSDSIAQSLDLVMLTHGWRRFKWDDVVKGKFPTIKWPSDSSYLTLSGKLYGVLPSNLRQGNMISLILSQKKSIGKIIVLPIESNGSFNDPSTLVFDTMHVYYQLPKKTLGDALVRFMEGILPPFPKNISASGINNGIYDTTGNAWHFQLSDEMNRILQQYEGKMLENVTVTTKAKSPVEIMDKKYTSGLFSGGDNYEFDIVNDQMAFTSGDVFRYLQSKVAGLQINPNSTPPTLQWRGGTPELFVNEIETDADMISSIPIADIAYVKVFRPPFMGGFNGSNGAIAIYTRKGDDAKVVPGKGLPNNMITGYSPIREFYAPNYSSFKQENEKRDVRTTLYWNPQVTTTPQKNKVILTFYNNDVTKSFRVVIEGMTKDGQLTHVEQIME